MADRIVEITRTGYLGNLKKALAGFLFGLLFIVGSFFLLSWNEGNSVKTHASLDWAEAEVKPATPEQITPALEGRVIHLAGDTTAPQAIRDGMFGFEVPDALRLYRKVEMYQWVEHKSSRDRETMTGGTESRTTYTYTKEWSETAHNSNDFREPQGHQNPAMPAHSEKQNAHGVMLGAYAVGNDVLALLENFTRPIVPQPQDGYGVHGELLYKGAAPENPQVGDMRVTFAAVPADAISIIGQQSGNKVVDATSPNGRSVLLVEAGMQDAKAMFTRAHTTASLITWGLRAAGVFLMYLGFMLVLAPLRAVIAFVPGLRWIVGIGLSLVSLCLALLLAGGTIAVAWFAYRPLLSAGVLGAAVLVTVFVAFARRGRTPTAADPVVQRF